MIKALRIQYRYSSEGGHTRPLYEVSLPLALFTPILFTLLFVLLLLLFLFLLCAPLVSPSFKPNGRGQADQVHPDGSEQGPEMQAETMRRSRIEKDDFAGHDVVVEWEDDKPLVERVQHRQGLKGGCYEVHEPLISTERRRASRKNAGRAPTD